MTFSILAMISAGDGPGGSDAGRGGPIQPSNKHDDKTSEIISGSFVLEPPKRKKRLRTLHRHIITIISTRRPVSNPKPQKRGRESFPGGD
jgi:hypothetical protein